MVDNYLDKLSREERNQEIKKLESFYRMFEDFNIIKPEHYLRQYNDYGHFFDAIFAFVLYKESGNPIPEELLEIIYRHFAKAIDGTCENDARLALGVGGSKSGPGPLEKWKTQQQNTHRLLMLEKMKNMGGDATLDMKIKGVAAWTGTTAKNLKRMYYENERRKK